MPDPFQPFQRNDECWCQSGRKYKACHGDIRCYPPGAPLPPDPGDGTIWVSPNTVLDRKALDSMVAQLEGEPIRMPSWEPVQRPQRVPELVARLAAVPARAPSVALDQLGKLRYELLDGLGLSNPATVDARLRGLSEADGEALFYGIVDLAKSTLDRLLEQAAGDEREVVLWAEPHDLERLVGQTLLFADRYLAPDALLAALAGGDVKVELAKPLRALLALRPLIEGALVVPVPDGVATVLTNDAVVAATNADLERRDLAEWVMSQLVVDGPTARSVAFVSARDDLGRGPGMFYLHANIDSSKIDSGVAGFEALHGYDADFDYQPWLDQIRRQTAAALVQDVNRELAIADAFGASFVTRAPFRARLLHRRGQSLSPAGATVWADVPLLPQLAAKDIAAISRADETVEALRAEMRRVFRFVESERAYETAVGLVDDLNEATATLEQQIRRERAWTLLVPAGASAGSAAIAVGGGAAAVAGALVGSLGLAQYVNSVKARRTNAAFAFVLAKRRSKGKRAGKVKAQLR